MNKSTTCPYCGDSEKYTTITETHTIRKCCKCDATIEKIERDHITEKINHVIDHIGKLIHIKTHVDMDSSTRSQIIELEDIIKLLRE